MKSYSIRLYLYRSQVVSKRSRLLMVDKSIIIYKKILYGSYILE
jgi:hypothetical protein